MIVRTTTSTMILLFVSVLYSRARTLDSMRFEMVWVLAM